MTPVEKIVCVSIVREVELGGVSTSTDKFSKWMSQLSFIVFNRQALTI